MRWGHRVNSREHFALGCFIAIRNTFQCIALFSDTTWLNTKLVVD